MSFLGVKVILFLVIPLIIKEKSNASALRTVDARVHTDRYEHEQRSVRDDFLKAFVEKSQYFQLTKAMFLAHQSLTYRSPPQQIPPLSQNAAMYNSLTLLCKSKKKGEKNKVIMVQKTKKQKNRGLLPYCQIK